MYGLVIESIVAFIRKNYGDDRWLEIRRLGKIEQHSFSTHLIYSETTIPRLVDTAADLLGLSREQLLTELGNFFVTFVSQYGYDKILRVLGRHMRDFLNGLDNLHEYMRFSYPKLKPPSFFVEKETERGLVLHYRSKRRYGGYVRYVMGQIKSVGDTFYGLDIDIELIKEEFVGNTVHVTMQLNFDNSAFLTEGVTSQDILDDMQVESELFFEAFPFHIVFTEDMIIKSIGHGLSNVMPNIEGYDISHVFVLKRPMMEFVWEQVMSHTNNVFEMESVDSVQKADEDSSYSFAEGDGDRSYKLSVDQSDISSDLLNQDGMKLHLKGEMIWTPEWQGMLFLGTPVLTHLTAMFDTGLFINDLSLHDNSRDLVLAGTQTSAELQLALDQEQVKSKKLEDSMKKLDEEMRRTDELLYQMIPRQIADRLRAGEPAVDTCQVFNDVTVLFSDVVGFTLICSRISPLQVVTMLNMMYSKFDHLCSIRDVYKVETIGDAYVVVSGAPEEVTDHAERIADMGLGMIQMMETLVDPSTGTHLQIRVGINSGVVVAGVVGLKMPRYCLFGDTVNTAAKMEASSEHMKIQMTGSTLKHVDKNPKYIILHRGLIDVKDKGKMDTYWISASPTYATIIEAEERMKNKSPIWATESSRPSRKNNPAPKITGSTDSSHPSKSPPGISTKSHANPLIEEKSEQNSQLKPVTASDTSSPPAKVVPNKSIEERRQSFKKVNGLSRTIVDSDGDDADRESLEMTTKVKQSITLPISKRTSPVISVESSPRALIEKNDKPKTSLKEAEKDKSPVISRSSSPRDVKSAKQKTNPPAWVPAEPKSRRKPESSPRPDRQLDEENIRTLLSHDMQPSSTRRLSKHKEQMNGLPNGHADEDEDYANQEYKNIISSDDEPAARSRRKKGKGNASKFVSPSPVVEIEKVLLNSPEPVIVNGARSATMHLAKENEKDDYPVSKPVIQDHSITKPAFSVVGPPTVFPQAKKPEVPVPSWHPEQSIKAPVPEKIKPKEKVTVPQHTTKPVVNEHKTGHEEKITFPKAPSPAKFQDIQMIPAFKRDEEEKVAFSPPKAEPVKEAKPTPPEPATTILQKTVVAEARPIIHSPLPTLVAEAPKAQTAPTTHAVSTPVQPFAPKPVVNAVEKKPLFPLPSPTTRAREAEPKKSKTPGPIRAFSKTNESQKELPEIAPEKPEPRTVYKPVRGYYKAPAVVARPNMPNGQPFPPLYPKKVDKGSQMTPRPTARSPSRNNLLNGHQDPKTIDESNEAKVSFLEPQAKEDAVPPVRKLSKKVSKPIIVSGLPLKRAEVTIDMQQWSPDKIRQTTTVPVPGINVPVVVPMAANGNVIPAAIPEKRPSVSSTATPKTVHGSRSSLVANIISPTKSNHFVFNGEQLPTSITDPLIQAVSAKLAEILVDELSMGNDKKISNPAKTASLMFEKGNAVIEGSRHSLPTDAGNRVKKQMTTTATSAGDIRRLERRIPASCTCNII